MFISNISEEIENLPNNQVTNTYILKSQNLDFSATPRYDPICQNNPTLITVHTDLRFSGGLKWFCVCVYKRLCPNSSKCSLYYQTILLKAVVKIELYCNRFKESAQMWKTFQSILYTYNRKSFSDGTNVSTMVQSKVGKNRTNDIDELQRKYPKFLHKLY